jgi:hypothetical protein
MSDVLEGLDVAEEVPQPDAPEAQVDPSPPADKEPQPRAEDGKFKGDDKPNSVESKPNSVKESPKDEPKTIPMAAYLEDRNKHRAEIEELRRQHQATLAELEKLKSPPKQPDPEPDFTNDPKAYVDTKLGAVLQKLEAGQTETKKTAEQAQQEANFVRFQQALSTSEHQFLSQSPDYYEALDHLRGLRIAELTTLNPSLTKDQVIEAIRSEEMQLAAQLMRAGRNPHQVAYQLAKARGYQPKVASPVSGASVLPNVPKTPQLPPDQTLGSGAGSPDASGETFLDPDDVFDKAFDEMFPRKRA